MDYQNLEKIKKTVEDFFKKTTFVVLVESVGENDNTVFVKLKSEEPKVLIGQNGQVLADTQHLLKLILKRKINEDFHLNVDINDYKKKKIEYLKETAKSMADEVFLDKKERVLTPMSSFERRIIHLEIQNRSDVITESVGEGEERRVVIKPRV
jgi:spoIIIJ-associated protein